MASDPGTDPELDAHLRQVLVDGPRPVLVTLSEPDERWPALYGELRARIVAALGGRALRIEHIGSTSVPGLAAKPIIDVLVTVGDVDGEAAEVVPALLAAGLVERAVEPGHRCLGTPARDANVHVWADDSPAVADHLLLRDRLRADVADRELYAETKRGLADRIWPDINYYAEAKGPVVQAILARARAQAATQK